MTVIQRKCRASNVTAPSSGRESYDSMSDGVLNAAVTEWLRELSVFEASRCLKSYLCLKHHNIHPIITSCDISCPQGLLLNFKPEVFSALKVYPMEKTEEETEPSISTAAAEDNRSNPACSTHSSDSSRSTTSVSTEELELSALLSRSSSEGEDGLQSTSPSPVHVPQPEERRHSPQPECSGGGDEAEESAGSQQEEAYVTMSSFYQIK